MFGFDPRRFDPELIALNLLINTLSNLDTLYIESDKSEIHLVGLKNGKAIYTTTIKVSE
jgi:hypothetical protein